MPDAGASCKRQICGYAKFQLKISGLQSATFIRPAKPGGVEAPARSRNPLALWLMNFGRCGKGGSGR